MLANGGEKIDDLTQEELILVSHYYSVSPTPYEQRRFDFFSDKEVLKSIQNKSNDFGVQFDMMFAIDMKLCDFGIEEMTDEQYNSAKKEMINNINSSSTEEVLNMVNVEERIIETMKQVNI